MRWGATRIAPVLPISPTPAPAHLPRSPAGVTRASATIPEMFEQRRLSRAPRVARSLSRVGRPLRHGRCASSPAKSKGLWSAETAPRRHPRGIMLALAVPFVGAAANWDCQRDHGRVFGCRLHPPVHVRCVVSRRVLCAQIGVPPLSRPLALRKRAPLLPPLEAGVLVSALHDVVGSSLLLLSSFYATCLNMFDRVGDCGLRPQAVNKAAPNAATRQQHHGTARNSKSICHVSSHGLLVRASAS
jgi:hypothetical protein